MDPNNTGQRPMSNPSIYSDREASHDRHSHGNYRSSAATTATDDAYDRGHAHGGDSRRESYLDPATSPNGNEDLRKFHSVGGAYTNVGAGGIHSEPSSPTMPQHDGEGDDNGDSSSSGSTKVESRSPSGYLVRGGNSYGLGGSSHEQAEVKTNSTTQIPVWNLVG